MKGLSPFVLVLLASILMLGGCAPDRSTTLSHYAPTGLPPIMPTGDFRAYIDGARAHATVVNKQAGTPIPDDDVAAVGPFELKPSPSNENCKEPSNGDYDKGVLLIHGLNDTPFSMWDLAFRFAKACYMVRGILLPGHGTVPGDLHDIGLPAWRDAVAKAVWGFRGHVDRLVLAGFDLGANLALDAALDLGFPPEIELDGIVMLAPAFAYEPPKFPPAAVGPGGDSLWGDAFNQQDALRYDRAIGASVAAVNGLGRELAERQAPNHIPLFVVASADDVVADPARVRSWFCGQATTPRHLLWYTRYPGRPLPDCSCVIRSRDPRRNTRTTCTSTRPSSFGPPLDKTAGGKDTTFPTGSSFNPYKMPKGHAGHAILDLAHMALLAAPDNPRYGARNERQACRHYAGVPVTPEALVCRGEAEGEGQHYLRYGEASAGNLRNYILRRLTYNPDFDHMAKAVLEFLDKND